MPERKVKPVNVVFDTNIVLSAILRDNIPEEILLFVLDSGDFKWIATLEIIEEYLNVLHRPKFGLPAGIIARWKNTFTERISLVSVTRHIEFQKDRKDEKFLECAHSGGALFLITGDKALLSVQKIGPSNILTASSFKRFICDNW